MWSWISSSPRSDSAPGTLKRLLSRPPRLAAAKPPSRKRTTHAARMRLRWAMTMSTQRAMGSAADPNRCYIGRTDQYCKGRSPWPRSPPIPSSATSAPSRPRTCSTTAAARSPATAPGSRSGSAPSTPRWPRSRSTTASCRSCSTSARADFQELTVQGAISFRVADPRRLARRVDFTIELAHGTLDAGAARAGGGAAHPARPAVRDRRARAASTCARSSPAASRRSATASRPGWRASRGAKQLAV